MAEREREIIKALDPLLARIAEIEEKREKTDREMLSVLRAIAARLGVPEIVIPPPVPVEVIVTLPPEKPPLPVEIGKPLPLPVIAKPEGPIRAFGHATTTSTFATIAELTPGADKTFHLTKIVVSCAEDVEAQLFWATKELTVIYRIMGKMPFTDWFPYNYRTHPDLRPIKGDGTSKLELKARYITTAADCYGEIVGEES